MSSGVLSFNDESSSPRYLLCELGEYVTATNATILDMTCIAVTTTGDLTSPTAA